MIVTIRDETTMSAEEYDETDEVWSDKRHRKVWLKSLEETVAKLPTDNPVTVVVSNIYDLEHERETDKVTRWSQNDKDRHYGFDDCNGEDEVEVFIYVDAGDIAAVEDAVVDFTTQFDGIFHNLAQKQQRKSKSGKAWAVWPYVNFGVNVHAHEEME